MRGKMKDNRAQINDVFGVSVPFSGHGKATANGKHDLVSELEKVTLLFG